MSIEAMSWALGVPIGGNAKVVLLGLANHAHADGTEAYPSKHTLATYAACDPSTAVRNVRKLQADGWIQADGSGPRGEAKYRLAMGEPFPVEGGDGDSPPVAPAHGGDGVDAAEGVAPVPPEPSLEPSGNRPIRKTAPADAFPAELPGDLLEPALAAGRILKAVAIRRGQARAVTRAAVGHAVLTFPDRDHVKVARDVEFWLEHGKGARRPCGDVVSRFRNFLDHSDPRPGPPLPGAPRSAAESSTGSSRLRAMAAELRKDPPQ